MFKRRLKLTKFTKISRTLFCAGSLLLLNSCSSVLELVQPNLATDMSVFKSGEFQLDTAHSSLIFKVKHMGLSYFVGRFNQFDANLAFNADQPEQAKLGAVVDMASLDVVDDDFEQTIKSDDWLNTAQFPKAYFETTTATQINSETLLFDGNLTFLDVTNPVKVEVKFNGAGTNLLTYSYTIGFSANMTFNRSDFGLDKYIPTVGDQILIEVEAEFQRN
ncbi:YceI-like domain-containing protein [Catenovulum agarivorans DS-2]|uniref:YceI-like domain-containing protein n=1 Tax=Catenovulum agarivorans DS-2 TaxID=1328313 RepID=W7QEV1_9ALTE|nr:YceI family protein [Catenovulum agarivorans]EWH11424.1 YceI-like domain-containing protein [Catenovulum agarivorans DS-2]